MTVETDFSNIYIEIHVYYNRLLLHDDMTVETDFSNINIGSNE